MEFYDSKGQIVRLGAEIGRGGEGIVFDVNDRHQFVAKVYRQPVDGEKATKLSLMSQLRTDRLLRLAAWPVDTLHNRPKGEVVGFLMPKISDHKPIHALYGPKDRLKTFSSATWPFLIHAATNIAIAFAVIHEHGHVIGDVNHGNLVASNEAIVKFIDCDSFQITAYGHKYLCEVGVSTHTPPELQARPLRGIIRTANHDAFGLAVLIFQLLFMGRHPFSGSYLGIGEMSLEKAIQEFRFAYGVNAASRQMKQPPATLPLTAVSESVALLFERAFSPEGIRQGYRPTPQDWIKALRELSANLILCKRHNGHHFLKPLSSCPWCEIESKAGILFFNFVITGTWQTDGVFNLDAVWAQISAVPRPGQLPMFPAPSSLNLQPSPIAIEQIKNRRVKKFLAAGLIVIVIVVILAFQVSGAAAFWIIIGVLALAAKIATAGADQIREKAEEKVKVAQWWWRSVEQRWQNEANDAQFTLKLRELEQLKAQYQDLPNLRLCKLQQLEKERRQRQLYKFLDSHQIYRASIPGIGASRTATLQSYGIETAADITKSAILAIPGFGPARTATLMEWRRSIERKFVFNPAQNIDPNDVAAVEREIGMMRLKLERDLQDGPAILGQISQQIMAKRQLLKSIVESALRDLAQAEADRKIL
jgi:DNA-binding helix-hairpin-helix protein with protein kinase domain